jgi:hypothetical protein
MTYKWQHKEYSLKVESLDLLTVLGKGAFGKVFLGKMA